MKEISLPRKWLVHDMEYFEYLHEDDYSQPVYSEPLTIKRVRVDESTTFTRDTTQNKIESDAIIFVDTKHSTPILDFKEKSKIIFKGKELIITKVVPFYFPELDKVRHYEIEVI